MKTFPKCELCLNHGTFCEMGTEEGKCPEHYAPINVNPVGAGECGQGVGILQILKFFDQIPQGGKRKVNQKCQKSPHPRGKI